MLNPETFVNVLEELTEFCAPDIGIKLLSPEETACCVVVNVASERADKLLLPPSDAVVGLELSIVTVPASEWATTVDVAIDALSAAKDSGTVAAVGVVALRSLRALRVNAAVDKELVDGVLFVELNELLAVAGPL
jgi:hypothetical protein